MRFRSTPGAALAAGLVALLPGLVASAALASYAEREDVAGFVEELVSRHHFDADELRELMRGVRPQKRVLQAIARPAEAKPWHQYRPIFVTDKRIRQGLAFWREHAALLEAVAQRYGVPAEIMVAIVGVESRYGAHVGHYRALDALATLAFDYPPRARFFRSELEQFLLLVRDEGLDPRRVMGSYAAAMGMPQFISSSYRSYAVDYDGDGRRDLWGSYGDVLGSVANYFQRHGWRAGEPVAVRVSPPDTRWRELLAPGLKPTLDRAALGGAGLELPADGIEAPFSVFALQGGSGAEVWVGYHNFYVLTRYNHSRLYAMAVYQLSQALSERRAGAGGAP